MCDCDIHQEAKGSLPSGTLLASSAFVLANVDSFSNADLYMIDIKTWLVSYDYYIVGTNGTSNFLSSRLGQLIFSKNLCSLISATPSLRFP
jgi:hypothetical protein